jgi:uncharacterized protein
MPLLIDGYNLLHAAGIIARGIGPGTLERARLALLNFLAASLDPQDIPRTTVVFDAYDPPGGLPRTLDHRGITVRFAEKGHSADELIVELIRLDSAPRSLAVVSSDHEIKRAARRRRAKAVDSDVWYAELLRERRQRIEAAAADAPARPPVPLLEEDINFWLRQFGGESLLTEIIERELSESERGENKSQESDSGEEPYNPFPPGYGEDLLEEL